jgi:hypothetical protein
LLGALFAKWTGKLVDIMTHDEKTNMGHRNGVHVRMV